LDMMPEEVKNKYAEFALCSFYGSIDVYKDHAIFKKNFRTKADVLVDALSLEQLDNFKQSMDFDIL